MNKKISEKIRIVNFIIIFCTVSLCLSAQEKELEHFRKELTSFVNYDTSSLSKSDANTVALRKNMEDAFLAFVTHKESKDVESLKRVGKTDGKNNYWFDNYTYSFSTIRRDMTKKPLENNADYKITFYGLYDYKLPNFISIYIQPFTIDEEAYVIYYYKLNGAGKYYIKKIKSNKVVYVGEALTSNAAIKALYTIDKEYFLILEDMGDDGQRALVLKKTGDILEAISAFRGKSFLFNSTDYSKKTFTEQRQYLRLASTRTIFTHMSFFESNKDLLTFDVPSKIISYSISPDNTKRITSQWKENRFDIDDYYLGEHLQDKSLPQD